MTSAVGGGVKESVVVRIRRGLKIFPLYGSPPHTKGNIFHACVRSVVLYGSET